MSNRAELETAVDKFRQSEAALASLATRLELLDESERELKADRADLGKLRERLRAEYAEELAAADERGTERVSGEVAALQSAAEALVATGQELSKAEHAAAGLRVELQDMTRELTSCARDLRSTAISLQGLRMDELSSRLAAIEKSTRLMQFASLVLVVLIVVVATLVVSFR